MRLVTIKDVIIAITEEIEFDKIASEIRELRAIKPDSQTLKRVRDIIARGKQKVAELEGKQ